MAEMLKLLRFVEVVVRGELVGVLCGDELEETVDASTGAAAGTGTYVGCGCGIVAIGGTPAK